MPVYNCTWELKESIESILHQTYLNYELIIVTDGSPTETMKIVNSYKNHPKVRIFHYFKQSGNAVRGRNKGIKEAKGEYIAFQDSDDVADRVRYFLDPVTLSVKRGVILASGSPPAYTEQESFSTLITDISNGASTPLFDYYDGNYTGSSLPLSMPVNILDVRLVKITIKIERDPNRAPELTTLTSQAALRNLKDNI